jgi:hypothetical protein
LLFFGRLLLKQKTLFVFLSVTFSLHEHRLFYADQTLPELITEIRHRNYSYVPIPRAGEAKFKWWFFTFQASWSEVFPTWSNSGRGRAKSR